MGDKTWQITRHVLLTLSWTEVEVSKAFNPESLFKDQTLVGFTSEMWKNLPQIIEDYYQKEFGPGSRRQRGQISSALKGGEKY